MASLYSSKNEGRRALVRNAIKEGRAIPNGIDFLEVAADQVTLTLTFFQDITGGLDASNVEISGGTRISGINAKSATPSGSRLTVVVNQPGDFSIYTLRLVRSPGNSAPPDNYDPVLSQVDFSFKVDCPSDFDCLPEQDCPPETFTSPPIDYLAKDFSSFRRIMLDRLSQLAPDQSERSPADLEVALVELVAYAADELSYYQDAVATEAYLGTARQRTSVRRHARLLDYPLQDGSNARAWLAMQVEPAADGKLLPGPREDQPGTLFLAGVDAPTAYLPPERLAEALNAGAQPFESMADLLLFTAHNEIHFFTWGETQYCLPAGSTRAWLLDDPADRLKLSPGDVLVFEEVRGPGSGKEPDGAPRPAGADPAHRCAVRLTQVNPPAVPDSDGQGNPIRLPGALHSDPLTGSSYVEIAWDAADALPFALCTAAEIDGSPLDDVSVARGNIAVADHGRSMPNALLNEIPEPVGSFIGGDITRPLIGLSPLTQQGRVRASSGEMLAFDPAAPAGSAFAWRMGDALPAIYLLESGQPGVRWLPERDLLSSDRFSRAFVVEVEVDGQARLRFGDGVFGARPSDLSALSAVYRVGSGRSGNVGPETITSLLTTLPGILSLRNPLPASGGADPETIQQAQLYAPQAFRTQERAVTAEDYADFAGRHPQVQRAQASLRWTGSWHTVFVTIDRKGGLAVDEDFRRQMLAYLEPYRIAGYDLEVNGPTYVPLDLSLAVCVAPGYFKADIQEALLRRLGSRTLPGGGRGFFHPDNFTFGQPVFLSQVFVAALKVDGVESLEALRFQRWGKTPNQELENGVLETGLLEVARLDNDPNFPENGRLELTMLGGL